jgi:hypothetical protein
MFKSHQSAVQNDIITTANKSSTILNKMSMEYIQEVLTTTQFRIFYILVSYLNTCSLKYTKLQIYLFWNAVPTLKVNDAAN